MLYNPLITKLNSTELKQLWQLLQQIPAVFVYNLNVTQNKYLPDGKNFFYTEFNPDRNLLRRPPQVIPSLNPEFDPIKFNFNKVNGIETLTTITYLNTDIALIINNSPLTKYHSLICPDLLGNHVQRITPLALSFSTALMRSLCENDFRIGYNSPGALASVNHLHLHLIYIEMDLYIDKAELEPLCDGYIYRLKETEPTEAICFLINKDDTNTSIVMKLERLYKFILWLCDNEMPHNLFITHDRNDATQGLKFFVYAREQYVVNKNMHSFNLGFCELSGYVPLGELKVFNALTEKVVVKRIREESGNVYQKIYDHLKTTKPEEISPKEPTTSGVGKSGERKERTDETMDMTEQIDARANAMAIDMETDDRGDHDNDDDDDDDDDDNDDDDDDDDQEERNSKYLKLSKGNE